MEITLQELIRALSSDDNTDGPTFIEGSDGPLGRVSDLRWLVDQLDLDLAQGSVPITAWGRL